jgi:hypothetical protein
MNTMLDSRVGKILVILYALASLVTYIVAYSCGGDTCGLYIVAPILPWAWILTEEFGFSFPWAVYPILVLVNASIAYVVGAGLERVYEVLQEHKRAVETPQQGETSETSPLL